MARRRLLGVRLMPGYVRTEGLGSADRRDPGVSPVRGAELLLADGDDLHRLHFLAVDRLEHVQDDPVVAFDDDFVTALDLFAGQRAAFFRGTFELRARGVA